MKRDFIPQDQLSEHDYLFDKSMFPYRWFSGKVMGLDPELNYLLYCQDLPGADITDPETWISSAPASDNQSSVKYRIGQTVNVQFPEGDFSFGRIIGLNRDYEKSENPLPTTDAIHENSAAQSITFDQLTNKYLIKNGAGSIESGPASVKMTFGGATVEADVASAKLSFGLVSLTVNATGITVSNGVITFNILTHTHLSATPGNPTTPPVIGS